MFTAKKILLIILWVSSVFVVTRYFSEAPKHTVIIPIVYLFGGITLFFLNKISVKWVIIYILILLIGFISLLQGVVFRINHI